MKQRIRDFWNAEACGERYGPHQDWLRYELEPEIVRFADFERAAGLSVLEIGTGMGSDFMRWVRAGAIATGIDLTERAINITKQRLVAAGSKAPLLVADAEHQPFTSNQFDLIYSWGVLHHTPGTARALNEAQRVLKPGGLLKVMLYHRYSWVAFAAWLRFGLFRARPFTTLREAIAHTESPGTQAFTKKEAIAMLDRFDHISVRSVLTYWDQKRIPAIPRLFGHRAGWFLLIEAAKPRS